MLRTFAALLLAAAGPAVPQPAYAAEHVIRTDVASCPAGSVLIGVGGHIDNGDGLVVLTGIVPNASRTAVTVTGQALAGAGPAWSVRAYADCNGSPDALAGVLVTGTGAGTASCPTNTEVTGAGFALPWSLPPALLTDLYPDTALTGVTVAARTITGAPVDAVGYALCGPLGHMQYLVSAPSATDTTSPKTAVLGIAGRVSLFGGRVTGPAFIDGLTRAPNGTYGVRARTAPPQPALRSGADEGWSVIATGAGYYYGY